MRQPPLSLNTLLEEAGFDDYVEALYQEHYDRSGNGRPSIPPGVYFRMLFVGYYEGIGSQEGSPGGAATAFRSARF